MPFHAFREPRIDPHQSVLGQQPLGCAALDFLVGSAGDEELGQFGKQFPHGIIGGEQAIAPIEDEGAGRQAVQHLGQAARAQSAATGLPALAPPPGDQRQDQLLDLGGMERLVDEKELVRRRHPLAQLDRVNLRLRRDQHDVDIRIQSPDLLGGPQAVEPAPEVEIDEGNRKGPALVDRRAHRVNGSLPLRHGDDTDFGKPLVPHGRADEVALQPSEQAVVPRLCNGDQNPLVVIEQADVVINDQRSNRVGSGHQIILDIRPLWASCLKITLRAVC